jgi:hypothetical protein
LLLPRVPLDPIPLLTELFRALVLTLSECATSGLELFVHVPGRRLDPQRSDPFLKPDPVACDLGTGSLGSFKLRVQRLDSLTAVLPPLLLGLNQPLPGVGDGLISREPRLLILFPRGTVAVHRCFEQPRFGTCPP